MREIETNLLIIGSGFSGRTVANTLGHSDYLIIDRGEFVQFSKLISKFDQLKTPNKKYWETAASVYESDLESNKTYNLSGSLKSFSQFHFIGGGSSNRWDGNAVRIPKHIFDDRATEYLEWPYSYNEMVPYYEKAEQLLNLCGDYHPNNPSKPMIKINSGDNARLLFGATNLSVYLRNQAKNPIRPIGSQNKCIGLGICEVCKVDAKARPENIFPQQNILYETLATKVLFDKNKATAVEYQNRHGEKGIIKFKKLVIAAHAIESARLIWHSKHNLPKGVKLGNVGHFFQDHAQANIITEAPFTPNLRAIPFKSSFEVLNMSKKVNGVDIRLSFGRGTSALTKREWRKWIGHETSKASLSFSELSQKSRNFLEFALTFEIPPTHNCYIDFNGSNPKLMHDEYGKLIQTYDGIYKKEVKPTLEANGFKIVSFRPHYRHIIGQHHLVGTLNMSRGEDAVVNKNFQLIGTDNVFVAGTSLIPRLGAPNPTLTAVALSYMLGEKLRTKG